MDFKYQDCEYISPKSNQEKVVYHYTSANSFFSILDSKKIWFSDCQFMNDRSEYVYIKEIFFNAIEGTSMDSGTHESRNRIVDYILGPLYCGIEPQNYTGNKIYKGLAGLAFTRFYLLCASLECDNLSLWNYYVKNNNYYGYNLGIKITNFTENIKKSGINITHGKINYDRDMQIKTLHNKILELDKKYNTNHLEEPLEDMAIEAYQDELSNYLIEKCLFYKNPAFAHEKEYRFVIEASTNETSDNKVEIGHHPNNIGLIVPHLKIGFPLEDAISEITLSPMAEKEVAKKGVDSLLANITKNKYHPIDINYSKINIRY